MSNTSQRVPESVAHTVTKKRRRRSVLLGLVILLCGFILGSGVTLVTVRHIILHVIHNPEKAPERITNKLQRRLDLSDVQAKEVKQIITERKQALIAIRDRALPKVNRELDLMRKQVTDVLTEEQAETWHKLFDRHRELWVPAASSGK